MDQIPCMETLSETDLGDIFELVVSLGLVSCQQDRVPRRPLLVLVPADEHQVEEVRVLTQETAAVPDGHHQLHNVHRLLGQHTHTLSLWQPHGHGTVCQLLSGTRRHCCLFVGI